MSNAFKDPWEHFAGTIFDPAGTTIRDMTGEDLSWRSFFDPGQFLLQRPGPKAPTGPSQPSTGQTGVPELPRTAYQPGADYSALLAQFAGGNAPNLQGFADALRGAPAYAAKPQMMQGDTMQDRGQMMANALRQDNMGPPAREAGPMSMGQFRNSIATQEGYPNSVAMLRAQPQLRPVLRGEFSKSINPNQTHTLESLLAQYKGQ